MAINIDKIHTTPMGKERISKNLNLTVDDPIEWCKGEIRKTNPESIKRIGKNWYVYGKDYVLTINANSNTIITAHRIK
ncbi:MAG: DUF3781 domain-containing protein [Culturomica sp.]|jgi:hypothetical protein|nr:DUF3781 domain-containing protein [Culturomica sp.]